METVESAPQGATQNQTGLKPCRSPYCECDPGQCKHPGCYDARGQDLAGAAAQPKNTCCSPGDPALARRIKQLEQVEVIARVILMRYDQLRGDDEQQAPELEALRAALGDAPEPPVTEQVKALVGQLDVAARHLRNSNHPASATAVGLAAGTLAVHCGKLGAGEALMRIRHRDTHEWRLKYWDWRVGDPWTWELHYLGSDNGAYIRVADQYEAQLLDETKRLVDTARGVLVTHPR